jgi:predicted transcriptional regulator
MGRAISHRCVIVKEWLRGREYTEISRNTHHSVPAIKNYISKFKRVVSLAKEGFDTHTIAFLVKLSASVVEEYYKLYSTLDIIPHRMEELNSFLKKSQSHQNHQSRQ